MAERPVDTRAREKSALVPAAAPSHGNESVLGLALLLFGAGAGLATTLVFLAQGAWQALRAGWVRLTSPAATRTSARDLSLWDRVHPLLFLGASALSAWHSPAPELAWPAAAMVATFILVFWSVQQQPLAPHGSPSEAAHYWVMGTLILASMGLGFFMEDSTIVRTPFLGKNGIGTLLAMALPVAQLVAIGGPHQVLGWVTAMVGAVALFLSFSQGGWIGAVTAQAVMLAAGTPRMRRHVVTLVLVVALVVALAASILWMARPPAFGVLLSRIDPTSSSKTERIYIWEGSWRMFLEHPWFGVGLGAFSRVYPDYRVSAAHEPNVSFAHNLLLNLLAETGVPGLAAFIAILATWLRQARKRLLQASPEEHEWVAVLLAALTALLTHQLFDGTMWSLHIGVGFWFLGAMLYRKRARPSNETCP